MRSIDELFYKTSAWIKCSKTYLKSVNGLCEECLKKGLIVPARIVHHKIHLNADNVNDPKISLSWSNLEAVCQDCHNKIHFGDRKKRYRIVDGELVIDDRDE